MPLKRHTYGVCIKYDISRTATFYYCPNDLTNTIYAIYRVIRKSVKHFKNSQQINYPTDHGSSYGSPTHYHKDVGEYLNRNLPQRWIGRTGKEDDALMRWPLRSPDLTPCEFFFWCFVKDTVFVPPLPANLQDLRNHITAAVALVDRDMLTRVWNEMDYRIDVCRITKGGHIEHL